ncbi:MAG: DUF167 domain-containing protein [Candidatus Woesearchaeota archaeon]
MNIHDYIVNNKIAVIVKPNSGKNRIAEWDAEENALRVELKAPAQENKANIELIKFLSKEAGRRAGIKTGLTSRKKIIVFE